MHTVSNKSVCRRRCLFCKKQAYSVCDATNPPMKEATYANTEEKMYGGRTAGMHGYSHMTGGWDGGQCEYMRVILGTLRTSPRSCSLCCQQRR